MCCPPTPTPTCLQAVGLQEPDECTRILTEYLEETRKDKRGNALPVDRKRRKKRSKDQVVGCFWKTAAAVNVVATSADFSVFATLFLDLPRVPPAALWNAPPARLWRRHGQLAAGLC